MVNSVFFNKPCLHTRKSPHGVRRRRPPQAVYQHLCHEPITRNHHPRKLACHNQTAIVEFFQTLPAFCAVVEATASYEWFVKLIEPLADKVLLAHPQKLRVIAESTRKSDKLDAQVLAEFLVLDMIPTAYRPTQRQQDHRRLVRQRDSIQRRITSVKNRIRRILSHHNADRKDLFTQEGLAWLQTFECSSADRFSLGQMLAEYHFQRAQFKEAETQLKTFAATSPIRERELCLMTALLKTGQPYDPIYSPA